MYIARTLRLREEECDDNKVDRVQADEHEVILPRDVGDGDSGNLVMHRNVSELE